MTNIFKKNKNKHVLAIQDFDNTMKAIEAGTLPLPYDNEIYKEMLATISNTCDTVKGINAFIRGQGLNRKDCLHFWEGKVTDGYTLIAVYYSEKATPDIRRLCDENTIVFLCTRE